MPAWIPTASYLNRSRLKAFAEANGHSDYASFLRWSQTDLEGFWRATDRDLDLVWARRYERVFDDSRGPEWTTWFTGSTASSTCRCRASRVLRQSSAVAKVCTCRS